MQNVSVCIPVGPNPAYLEWLPEAVDSALNQTHLPNEIIIVDDKANLPTNYIHNLFGGGLSAHSYGDYEDEYGYWCDGMSDGVIIRVFKAPCRLGVATAFNMGVALSYNNLVFMMGSDDILKPECLSACVREYETQGIEGWYNVTIETQSGEQQWIPNHAAMVTQELFKWFEKGNGYYGFPPSSGCGGPDALLLSILMVHAPERIIQVQQGTPLYWVREHEHQMTRQDAAFFGTVMVSIRNKETERFNPHV